MQLRELMEDFNVPEILFRDWHTQKIEESFNHFKKFGVATNLSLCGVTGSGKTMCLTNVMKRHPSEYIYVSASMKKRTNQVLSLISGKNVRSSEVLLENTVNKIKLEQKILIIDELNKLEDPKTLFDDLNTIYRESGVPIIVITNNPLIMNNINDDARLTLLFSRVDFRPYHALELRNICTQRLGLLPKELVKRVDEFLVEKICAYAAKSGSARRALGLLRKCIIEQRFDQEELDSIVKEEDYLSLQSYVNSMNEIERRFLKVMIDIYYEKMNSESEDEREDIYITPRDLQEALPDINVSKISQLITTFENDYGFISTRFYQKGRGGGRYRRIDFIDNNTFDQLGAVV